MNKKRVVILTVGIIFVGLIVWVTNIKKKNNDYNTREMFIVDELKLGSLDFFQVYSSDCINNVEIFQFAFSENNDAYIGFAVFFHEDYRNKIYEQDNLISMDYDIIKDEYPFSLYSFSFNIPVRFRSIENEELNYQYYYGCINDKKIKEIVFEFSNEYVHIIPIAEKYYTLGIVDREDLLCVKGLNKEMNTIYEYSF